LTAEDVGARPNTWIPSPGDIGAEISGAADTALVRAKEYTDAEIIEWIGNKKVSEQINSAVNETNLQVSQ
jgi:hypothetical protein